MSQVTGQLLTPVLAGDVLTDNGPGKLPTFLAIPTPTWTAAPFSAGNFTAATGTWTVTSGQMLTFDYTINGHMMTVLFLINNSTGLSNITASLSMVIPASKTAIQTSGSAFCYEANGTSGTGLVWCEASLTTIFLQPGITGNFAAGAFSAWGQITIEV